MITSSNFNISLQGGPREGGSTENKKSKANHHPRKTCASGGARFLDPTRPKGSVRFAQPRTQMGHKSTSETIKKPNQTQRRNQSCIKRGMWLIWTEFQHCYGDVKRSKPCKGCSKSNFACMRNTTWTNTICRSISGPKTAPRGTQNHSKMHER